MQAKPTIHTEARLVQDAFPLVFEVCLPRLPDDVATPALMLVNFHTGDAQDATHLALSNTETLSDGSLIQIGFCATYMTMSV